MTHSAEECAREDFGVALDTMNAAIRQITAESNHCGYPLSEMLVALLCAAHAITGATFSPEELQEIGARANTIIEAVEAQDDFEEEVLAGLDEIEVIDMPARVLLSVADTNAIAERVAELLRVGADG